MSNYHILKASENGNTIQVIFHVPVPITTNMVGIEYQTCIVEDTTVNKMSKVPWITIEEQSQLNTGELVEISRTLHTHKDISNADKMSSVNLMFTNGVPIIQERIRQKYIYWHFNGDV